MSSTLPMKTAGTAIQPAEPAERYSVGDLEVIAKKMAASRLFPGIETEQAAFALMMICQAEGLHPAQAMRRYHIIEGRPSMKADAMQAEFQRQGGIVRWRKSTAEECVAEFGHPTHAPEPVEIKVTLKELVDSGVATTWNAKNNKSEVKGVYKKFPAQMLRARTISQGVRMVLPGVVAGIYTPEEVGDFERPEGRRQVTTRVSEPEAIEASFTEAETQTTEPEPAPRQAPAKPPQTFVSWASKFAHEFNQEWSNHEAIEAVDKEDRGKMIDHVEEIVNFVVSNAIEKGAVSMESVLNAEGKRDPKKSKEVAADLFARAPGRIKDRVRDHYRTKAREACVLLSIDPGTFGEFAGPEDKGQTVAEIMDAKAELEPAPA